MKIAFAMINCNRRDGSARPVNEVAERLAKRGHEVHLYARRAEDIDLSGIRWHKITGPAWPEVADFWTYYQRVNHALAKEKFDIVHSIGCNTLLANVITIQNIQPAKELAMVRFGKDERISIPRKFSRRLYAIVTARAEHQLYTARKEKSAPLFLPVSRGVEAELRRHYAIGKAPVRIIPNAADVRIFHPLDEQQRNSWRTSCGISKDDFLAIFCGGEWTRKGLEYAIRGVARTSDRRIKLFVAGDDPDERRFRQMAADLDAADRIVFGGFRQDIASALGASDIFLFPSHYEAFSLATIEAAACGLPLVATKINGTEDLIQPGINGEFIEHDPEQIAAVLSRLSEQPEHLRKMGRCARQTVEENYTWDRVADMTEEAYRCLRP